MSRSAKKQPEVYEEEDGEITKLGLLVPSELKTRLKTYCAGAGTTMTDVVIFLVEGYLEENEA